MDLSSRVTKLNNTAENTKGRYVLYWMQIFKRASHNYALNFAIQMANERRLPLIVYEGLKFYYPWASDRIHTFILEGVAEKQTEFDERGIRYVFYLQRHGRDPKNTVARLAKEAVLLVTDDFPCFIIPDHNAHIAQVNLSVFAVDANGMVPLSALPKEEYAAYTIRPKINRLLPDSPRTIVTPHLDVQKPKLEVDCPENTVSDDNIADLVSQCDIDHTVKPSELYRGGTELGRKRLKHFVRNILPNYLDTRTEPSVDGTSRLSPYLHFGFVSIQEIVKAVEHADAPKPAKAAFLEQAIVRRELSFNLTRHNPHYDSLRSLPEWAQQTMREHANDPRPELIEEERIEAAETYDELWNASQRELVDTGLLHNYVRMLWGKRVIEWQRSYEMAFELLVHLNNKYALDGRDPNSYAGILWCFGKHDRPWFEREIFGTIRYMTSRSMGKKFKSKDYIESMSNGSTEPQRVLFTQTVMALPIRQFSEQDTVSIAELYQQVRARTMQIVAPLEIEDYVIQTAEFMSPPRWHIGHTSWFFETVLQAHKPGYRVYSEDFLFYFNSYYEGFGERIERPKRGTKSRPTVKETVAYRQHIDEQVLAFLKSPDSLKSADLLLSLVRLGLEHEMQHQELLVYDIKHLLCVQFNVPLKPLQEPSVKIEGMAEIEGGLFWLGYDQSGGKPPHSRETPRSYEFGFDNEKPEHQVFLQDFAIDKALVSNGDFLEFIKDGGYQNFRWWFSEGWEAVNREHWQAPLYWELHDEEWMIRDFSGLQTAVSRKAEPVCHVSFFEASAFAKWAGKRLPTEGEWEKAACYDERRKVKNAFPWGDRDPDSGNTNLFENGFWSVAPIGAFPNGANAYGCHQMIGDVWEWTTSDYVPYPGFKSEFDEYNDKWFVNQKVLRGGSFATPQVHIRATYRNFFHAHERWMTSGFRCAQDR